MGSVVPRERNCTVTREECDVQCTDIFDQSNAHTGGNPITVVSRDVLAQRS
jgi:hypothetical protein